jgi:uncharacterized tellurite resistance protein B-like protein
MPIILLILGALAFWVAFWFIRFGGINVMRQRSARRKEEQRQQAARDDAVLAHLRSFIDPRDAAAVLMLLIARHDGPLTRAQISLIEHKLRRVSGSDAELTECMTRAHYVAGETKDLAEAVELYRGVFQVELTEDERRELIDMLEDVARLEGGPSEGQASAIAALKRAIGR